MSSPDKDRNLHWVYRTENRPKLWWGLGVVLFLSVAAQAFFHVHAYFTLEGWFGFNAVYGFLACAAMVLFAKLLGFLLKRPEDYYDND